MSADRDATVKKADGLRKRGKLAAAIAEYVGLLARRPDDFASTNTLGDLYVEAGQPHNAVEQFRRVGDHLFDEGFYPRAAAVYKKILKVRSDDDHALARLASIAERQRHPAEARTYLERLVAARNGRRDEIGAAEILVRLAALDAADEPARPAARPAGARPQEPAAATSEPRAGRSAGTEAAVVEPEAPPAPDVPGPSPTDEASVAKADGESEASSTEPEASSTEPAPPAPPTLTDVFGAMRARVGGESEARAREQYAHAVTCLDDGRVEEAVAGLEEAARVPFVRFEAASRLGRLFADRGDLARAVEWMERAAEVPPTTPDEGTELRYDLADALEQAGERARALSVLKAIEAEVGEFRDVRERIEWLSEIEADGDRA